MNEEPTTGPGLGFVSDTKIKKPWSLPFKSEEHGTTVQVEGDVQTRAFRHGRVWPLVMAEIWDLQFQKES